MKQSIANMALEQACINLDANAVAQALSNGADPAAVDDKKTPMLVLAVDTNYGYNDTYRRMKDVVSLLLDAGADPNQACPPGSDGMETVSLQLIVSRIMHDYMDADRVGDALAVMELLLEKGASPTPRILLPHGVGDMMGGIIGAIRNHHDINDPNFASEDFDPDLFRDSCARMAVMLARHGAPRVGQRIRFLQLGDAREQSTMAVVSELSMAKATPAAPDGKRAMRRV